MNTNQRHDETHEELLLAAICGDLDRDDARLVERMTACPVCQQELTEQQALAETFAVWGRDQRQVQRALSAGRQVAGSDLVAPFVRARAGERGERVARAPSHSWAPLAAAAALAVTTGGVWMAAQSSIDGGPPPQVFLGEDSSGLRIERAEDGRLRAVWPPELPAGGWFELGFRSIDGLALPLAREKVAEAQWTPSSEQAAVLPETFELEVLVLDAGGDPVDKYQRTVSP